MNGREVFRHAIQKISGVIEETLVETGFNISEAARRLGMHRRTLARKLEKRQVR